MLSKQTDLMCCIPNQRDSIKDYIDDVPLLVMRNGVLTPVHIHNKRVKPKWKLKNKLKKIKQKTTKKELTIYKETPIRVLRDKENKTELKGKKKERHRNKP